MEPDELRRSSVFADLSADDLRWCADKFEIRDVPAGTSLASEGDFSYRFFVVLDGDVDVHRDFERVARLGPGDVFGETGVAEGERRNARVTSATRCRVAWMMGWDFREMTGRLPAVAQQIDQVIEERTPDE